MTPRFDEPDGYEDEWLDDPEAPQPEDLDDEDETPTVPCAGCGELIPDFVDRCPYCGDWVVQSAGSSSGRAGWYVVAVIVVVCIVLTWVLW